MRIGLSPQKDDLIDATWLYWQLAMDTYNHILNIEMRYRKRQWWLVVGVIASGVALLFWPMPEVSIGGRLLVRITGGGVLFAGLLLVIYLMRWPPFRNPLVAEALFKEPELVVWVYHEVMQTMPFGITVLQRITVCLARTDRTTLVLRVDPDEFDLLWKELHELLPHATFGYSKEKAFMYKTEPRLLLKSE
jgi:hypothetical protein